MRDLTVVVEIIPTFKSGWSKAVTLLYQVDPVSRTGPPGLQGHMILCPLRNKFRPFISSLLCTLWHRCLVPFACVEIWTWFTQHEDPNPQRQGPLPVCCLCRFAPCSVFSVRGKLFPLLRNNMNGSFVGWSSCWFGMSPLLDHHHCTWPPQIPLPQ